MLFSLFAIIIKVATRNILPVRQRSFCFGVSPKQLVLWKVQDLERTTCEVLQLCTRIDIFMYFLSGVCFVNCLHLILIGGWTEFLLSCQYVFYWLSLLFAKNFRKRNIFQSSLVEKIKTCLIFSTTKLGELDALQIILYGLKAWVFHRDPDERCLRSL
jgi:hypothetical protein